MVCYYLFRMLSSWNTIFFIKIALLLYKIKNSDSFVVVCEISNLFRDHVSEPFELTVMIIPSARKIPSKYSAYLLQISRKGKLLFSEKLTEDSTRPTKWGFFLNDYKSSTNFQIWIIFQVLSWIFKVNFIV